MSTSKPAAAASRRNRASLSLVAAIALALLVAIPMPPAYAQPPAWDGEELEVFLDPIIAQGMAENYIPGVALVIVKDGEILLSKGYGYADLEAQIPVDPKTTVFQHMPVSKLFTATAIMQLVEGGQVDLDADVNTYLTGYRFSPTGTCWASGGDVTGLVYAHHSPGDAPAMLDRGIGAHAKGDHL